MEQEIDIEKELKILADIKSRIKGNPLCHRAGCYGSGNRGIEIVLVEGKSKPRLLTCECAQIGETDYARLYDKIAQQDLHAADLIKNFVELIQLVNQSFENLNTVITEANATSRKLFTVIEESQIELYRHTLSGFIYWKWQSMVDTIRLKWISRKLTAKK